MSRDNPARVADSTGNWVDPLAPQWARPICGCRASIVRSALAPADALLVVGGARGRHGADVRGLPLAVVLFFLGAFVMRGAGCTWNDITDRDLDDKVERTRSRPLPSGQVSVKQARPSWSRRR